MLYKRKNTIEAIYWSGEQKDVYQVMDWLHQFEFVKRFGWGTRYGLFIINIEQQNYPTIEVKGNTYLVVRQIEKDIKVIDIIPKWKFEEEYEICDSQLSMS